jgi:hypothetical protein
MHATHSFSFVHYSFWAIQLIWLSRAVSWHCVLPYSRRLLYSLMSTMQPGGGRSSEPLSTFHSVAVSKSESMSMRLSSYGSRKTYKTHNVSCAKHNGSSANLQLILEAFRRIGIHKMKSNQIPLLVRVIRNPKESHSNHTTNHTGTAFLLFL